jgi:hypothetical protein
MTDIERAIMPPEKWFFNDCGTGDSMYLSIAHVGIHS